MWKKIIIITTIIVVADQLSKFFICKYPGDYKVLGNFLRFTLIKNPYGVFGINCKIPIIPVTIISIFLIFVLFYKLRNIFIALILGGAIGNLIDRLIYGEVVDWLNFGIGDLRWPIFNLADASITIGIFLIIFKNGVFNKCKQKI